MKKKDQITIETQLDWEQGDNGVHYFYEANYNEHIVVLIRNYQEERWFAMFNDKKHTSLLPLEAQGTVNELVEQVEDYLESL